MASDSTYHIVPASAGEWALQIGEDPDTTTVHQTQGLAVAKAWELAQDRVAVEVVVHGPGGLILAKLLIRRAVESPASDEPDPDEDQVLRREAERITPSRERLDALIDRLAPSSIDYGQEDAELPC